MMKYYRQVLTRHHGLLATLINPKAAAIAETDILTKKGALVFYPVRRFNTLDDLLHKNNHGKLNEKNLKEISEEKGVSLKASYMTADQHFRNSESMFPFYKDVKTDKKDIAQIVSEKCQGLEPMKVLNVLEDGAFSGLLHNFPHVLTNILY
jgi:hypothetical protein